MIPIITGVIGIFVAVIIILLMRRDRLHAQHGFGWIVVAGSFALLGFSPRITDSLAGYLGIAYPPILALTLAVVILVIKILLMDIERSRIETRNQRLVQRVAMLEADLKNMLPSKEDSSQDSPEAPSLNKSDYSSMN